jgi:hypothetical protein
MVTMPQFDLIELLSRPDASELGNYTNFNVRASGYRARLERQYAGFGIDVIESGVNLFRQAQNAAAALFGGAIPFPRLPVSIPSYPGQSSPYEYLTTTDVWYPGAQAPTQKPLVIPSEVALAADEIESKHVSGLWRLAEQNWDDTDKQYRFVNSRTGFTIHRVFKGG